jgi:hypothetical protein
VEDSTGGTRGGTACTEADNPDRPPEGPGVSTWSVSLFRFMSGWEIHQAPGGDLCLAWLGKQLFESNKADQTQCNVGQK